MLSALDKQDPGTEKTAIEFLIALDPPEFAGVIPGLHENDVELLLVVGRFDLK